MSIEVFLFDLCQLLFHILVPHEGDGINNDQPIEQRLKEKYSTVAYVVASGPIGQEGEV